MICPHCHAPSDWSDRIFSAGQSMAASLGKVSDRVFQKWTREQERRAKVQLALQGLLDAHAGSTHALDGPVWKALQKAHAVILEVGDIPQPENSEEKI
jgi:hypothetical protein